MNIAKLMIDPGPAVYHTAKFRQIYEDHIPTLKTTVGTTVHTVDTAKAQHNHNNLYNYLLDLKVPVFLHWPILRLNGYTTEREFDFPDVLLIPDEKIVVQLASVTASTYAR